MITILTVAVKLSRWLAQALIIQLFLLSLSFPVLVSWGIGFSPLIFLGNIIFTPILTLFLAFSCLIYVFELFFLPNDWLCVILDLIAQCWMSMMAWAPNISPDISMIACPQAPAWLLIFMPLGAWAILRSFGLKNCLTTLSFLMLWVCIVFCGIKWSFTPVSKEFQLACGARNVTLKLKDKKVILIDNESVSQSRACSQAWIDYTLSSELIKKFGATTIDAIVIAKGTPAALLRLKILCKRYHCKKVFDMHGSCLVPELQI